MTKKRLLIDGDLDGINAELLLRALHGHFHEWDNITDKPVFHNICFSGSFKDLIDVPVMFSGDYDDLDNKPDLFSGSYNDLTDKPILFDWDYNSLLNKPTIPAAQIQSDWTQTNASALDFIKNKPIKTFNNPTRALNTSFQISTTRDMSVSYTIPITAVAALLVGARGRVTLSYADDAAQTVNVKTVAVSEYGIGSGLVVTGYGVLELSGIIPVGKYVRLTSANVQGTPSFGSVVSQEVAI